MASNLRSGSLSSSETDLPEVKRSHHDSHTRFQKPSSPKSDLTEVNRSYLNINLTVHPDSDATEVKRSYIDTSTTSRDLADKPYSEDKRKRPHINNGLVNIKDVTFKEIPRSRHFIEQMNYREQENKKDKRETKGWLYKLVTGIIVIIAAILGTIFFIIYYTHSSSSSQNTSTDKKCARTQAIIGFSDILTVNCVISLGSNAYLSHLRILFKPKYTLYQSVKRFDFNLTEDSITTYGWNITIFNNTKNSKETRFVITREPAKCDSGGIYTFQFNSSVNTIVLEHTEDFEIMSKVSDVTMEVSYNNVSDGGYYELACSAQSACTLAPISLLGTLNNGESTPLFGANFTCILNYNDNNGWTVKCTGTIPQNVYSSLSSIACRPTTGNKTADDENERKFACKDCIFQCPKDSGDSYWYDPKKCNIFHRCVFGKLYTMPCSATTYFNTKTCTCDFAANIADTCDKLDAARLTQKEENVTCS